MKDNRIWNLAVKMVTRDLSGRNGILAHLVWISMNSPALNASTAYCCLDFIFMLLFIIRPEATLQSNIHSNIVLAADSKMTSWHYVVGGSELVHCEASAVSFHIMTAGCVVTFHRESVHWQEASLMERKHYVKRCKLIIADRYWLASHFFAADSSELAIWVVSRLSQVIGIGGKTSHIHMQPQKHIEECVCRRECEDMLLSWIQLRLN